MLGIAMSVVDEGALHGVSFAHTPWFGFPFGFGHFGPAEPGTNPSTELTMTAPAMMNFFINPPRVDDRLP